MRGTKSRGNLNCSLGKVSISLASIIWLFILPISSLTPSSFGVEKKMTEEKKIEGTINYAGEIINQIGKEEKIEGAYKLKEFFSEDSPFYSLFDLLPLASPLISDYQEIELTPFLKSVDIKEDEARAFLKLRLKYLRQGKRYDRNFEFSLYLKKEGEDWKILGFNPLSPEKFSPKELVKISPDNWTFVQITDIEGKVESLERAVAYINERLNPSFILITGDLGKPLIQIKDALDKLDSPYYAIPGDNDNEDEFEKIFGTALHSFDFANLHFIGLNDIGEREKGEIRNIDWLKKELRKNRRKKVILFFHIPYFLCKNQEEISSILNSSSVILTLCGHMNLEFQIKEGKVLHWCGDGFFKENHPFYQFIVDKNSLYLRKIFQKDGKFEASSPQPLIKK